MYKQLVYLFTVAVLTHVSACAQNSVELSEDAKLSYALGMGQAGLLRQYAVTVDPDMYSKGLHDALSGNSTLMTEDEARSLRVALRDELREEQDAVRARALTDASAANKQAGDTFRAANKKKDGVVTLESGLQYRVIESGTGGKPTIDDVVEVRYRGTLVNGKEFANTYRHPRPANYQLRKVIPGWREGLLQMQVGSKWEIVVPPDLAYGDRLAGRRIGPNSTLVFEVELLSINASEHAM